MSGSALYWRDWSESRLAAYQGDQGSSNHCAKYAAASALNLLYGMRLDGGELVAWAGSRPLRGTGRYTIWGNDNGSLVFQAANLVRQLAQQQGILPRVSCRRISALDLLGLLGEKDTLTLVSLTYWEGQEPGIASGRDASSALGPARWVGGHIMIPAAWDPGHRSQAGASTPWGFLSSWGAGEQLYWMTEDDFHRSWGKLSIFNTAVVERQEG